MQNALFIPSFSKLSGAFLILFLSCTSTFSANSSSPDLYSADKFGPDNYSNEYRHSYPLSIGSPTRACIGEKMCPVAVDSMFPCGYTEARAANELCTLYKFDGTKFIMDHTISHQGEHEGHQCGYDWFSVTCVR